MKVALVMFASASGKTVKAKWQRLHSCYWDTKINTLMPIITSKSSLTVLYILIMTEVITFLMYLTLNTFR